MMTGLDRLQAVIDNPLSVPEGAKWLAGIIGDKPSTYAKSPSLWNAAFHDLGFPGISLPFDVSSDRLGAVITSLKSMPEFLGCAVTQPYKVSAMSLLDDVDATARRIGAVNLIVREESGRLIGYNTDGPASVEALIGRSDSGQFLETLKGHRVVMIGAGGAARAVAVCVAAALDGAGHLTIVNRDESKAKAIADAVGGSVSAAGEAALEDLLGGASLIVNASTKGQAGIRRLPDGRATCLEAYSSLAPASPAIVSGNQSDAEIYRAWFAASQDDIAGNRRRARARIAALPTDTAVFDLVYAPFESRLLCDARLSGRRGLNGKSMNITQAVLAFVDYAMPRHLSGLGLDRTAAFKRVYAAMAAKW